MSQPFNREHIMELLPLDLRPFVELHDFDEAFESYPLLGATDHPIFIGVSHLRSVIATILTPILELEIHSDYEGPFRLCQLSAKLLRLPG